MYMPPPMGPKPERFMFDSDEKYLAARKTYAAEKRNRDNAMKTNLAFHIVIGAVMIIMAFLMMCLPLYMSFGWYGPIGLILSGGLFWAAVSRVKMWL